MRKGKQHSGRRPPSVLSCNGKKIYDHATADDTARHVAATTGALMSSYRCLHGCKLLDGSPAWHIGHQNTRITRH